MKLFQKIQSNLSKLGYSPTKYSAKNVALVTLTSSLMVFYFLSTFWFSCFESKTFIEFNEALFVCVTSLLHLSEYVVLLSERSQIFQLIDRLEVIVQQRMEIVRMESIYRETNDKIEEWSSSIYKRIVNVGQIYLAPNVIVSIFTWFQSDYSNESFKLPYPASFPYDWRTPAGYLTAVSIQTIIIRYVCTCLACITSLFIAFSKFFMIFITDLESSVNELDVNVEMVHRNALKWIEKKRMLYQIMQLHADAKQLGYEFVQVFDKFVMNYFLNGIATMCTMMVVVQMAIDSGNLQLIASPFAALIAVESMIFLFCYFGDDITRRFADVSIHIFHCKWYFYPIKMQRDLVTVLIVAGKPVNVRGLGILYCTRELFLKNLNTGFSCFMVLRQIKH